MMEEIELVAGGGTRGGADDCVGCVFELSSTPCPRTEGGLTCVAHLSPGVPYQNMIWRKKAPVLAVQTDPNGIDQHAPGAKLDAGKAEYDMVMFSFPAALAAVDAVGKFGAQKYSKGGFRHVPDAVRRYGNAAQRHWLKHLGGEYRDAESGKLHLAHKAWCALAELELFMEANPDD